MDSLTNSRLQHTPGKMCMVVFLCLLGHVLSQEVSTPQPTTSPLFDLTYEANSTTVILSEGDMIATNITITAVHIGGTFQISAEKIRGNASFEVQVLLADDNEKLVEGMDLDYKITLLVDARGLAIGKYHVVATDTSDPKNKHILFYQYVKIKRVTIRFAAIVRYLVLAMVMLIIFIIGVTTDLKIIYNILRRPWGVIIGLLCQFIIMPLTAYILAKAFQIDGASSVGLVLDGSCPGGSLSNILSVIMDLDYVLSITMTFFSTLFALGMMPLNLFLYASSFVEAGETIRTPFLEIFIQMATLVIPLCLGIGLAYKWPSSRDRCEKYLKPVSGLGIVVLICADLPFNLYIFNVPPRYYLTALLFPAIGFTLGVIISKLVCLPSRSATTVGVETGVQNAILAITVLYFFYPQPESDLASRLPYLILIFTTVEGAIANVIYTLLKRFYWHGIPWDDDLAASPEELAEKEKQAAAEANGKPSVPSVSEEVRQKDQGCQVELGEDTYAKVNEAYDPYYS